MIVKLHTGYDITLVPLINFNIQVSHEWTTFPTVQLLIVEMYDKVCLCKFSLKVGKEGDNSSL